MVSPSQADLSSTQRSITRLIMVLIKILASGPLASRSAVRLKLQSEPLHMRLLVISNSYDPYSRVVISLLMDQLQHLIVINTIGIPLRVLRKLLEIPQKCCLYPFGTASETFIAKLQKMLFSSEYLEKLKNLFSRSVKLVFLDSLLSQEPLSNVRLMIMLVLELQRLLAMQRLDLLVYLVKAAPPLTVAVLPFSVNLTIQILIIRHIMVLTRILALVQVVSWSPSVQVVWFGNPIGGRYSHQWAMRVELKDLVVLVLNLQT